MKHTKTLFAIFLVIVFLVENTNAINACEVSSTSILGRQIEASVQCETASEERDDYAISYILNGGVNIWDNPHSFDATDLPLALHVPARSGFNFAGWYLESNYQTKVTEINPQEMGDVTLYAKWTKQIDDDYNVQMYSYKTGSMISGTDKELKNCDYSFLQHIEIPGMPSTREEDLIANRISDVSQCPQGICITDDYILVTAYCSDNNDAVGSLHVFDKRDGEYLVTLGLKKESHLGGIAFDGNSVWVCHSDNQTLERIPYGTIKRLAKQKSQTCVDCSANIADFKINNRPSCISWYNGTLYVATQTQFFNSEMKAYEFVGDTLIEQDSYRIPSKVQGIAFDNSGKIYLSTSYGRTKSSYLKVYDSLAELDEKPTKPHVKVEMPPCSEEVEIADGNIYVLFESAGSKYFEGTDGNGTSISPLDKILAINLSSL